ncbi:hypothetical protein J437_LFUL000802 [Ladona fulva]|uniref:Uncharacterized protein n=1 Tax=Ladona fulva TaxID=123851 RepID=A0A8K0KT05_LADFU|nr:hypothetical protein J437_LFUL000802 [Ladona fulva]
MELRRIGQQLFASSWTRNFPMGRTRRTHCLATTFADITPMDFFLWGFVKDRVYATKVDDIPMLRCRITDAMQQ